MTTDERTHFALACRDNGAPAPVLTGVTAHGRLDAVLFEMTLRQTYRNASDRVLEVVYTFPLPQRAVLLGFVCELNGQLQEGSIVAKREAERQYEASLAEGDAPVMLEALNDGLHSANIGNLQPGDEVVLELRFAQLLSFEQGRLRVAIPTTIAPRYGSAERAGLQPQQVPLASLEAAYPLTLSLTIGDALAGAAVTCPSHRLEMTRTADGATRLDLAPSAWLDRDVVVVVTPREPRPSLVIRADNRFDPSAPVVVMAALQPPAGRPRERIAIKLLVDCSGSMAGDSIASARVALQGVVAGLSERDCLSLSRFGQTVEHLLAPTEATPHALRHLRRTIDAIDADLGGTEMASALAAVFELPCGRDSVVADVLLITDGEVWQTGDLIAAARKSGQRVFAIGVGASPAEGVLRNLAEATGGACEFVTPGEALEAASQRMLQRMRQPAWTNVRVDWGGTPAWYSGPASSVFGGDTVIALAGFTGAPRASAIRLLADDAMGVATELARAEADAPCRGDTLPRIAAAGRISQAPDELALALALQYQLMSGQTHCVLVHRRADADKAAEEAELHRVTAMLAAGWGASSTVMASAFAYDSAGPGAAFSAPARGMADPVHMVYLESAEGEEIPSFTLMVDADVEPASIETIARSVAQHFADGGQIEGLALHCAALVLHPDVQRALEDILRCSLDLGQAWLLLAHWANTRAHGLGDPALAATLQPQLAAIDPESIAQMMGHFDCELGSHAVDGWRLSRADRLRRAQC